MFRYDFAVSGINLSALGVGSSISYRLDHHVLLSFGGALWQVGAALL